jgi:hypothetical protein
MKRILKLAFTFLVAGCLFSCKKNVATISYEGGTAPVLTATKSGTIPLSFATKDNEAVRLSWTNPNYQFSTGLSSQDVSYLLEIDTTGSNFTNPNRKAIGLSKELTIAFSQNDLNDYLLNTLSLTAGSPHNVEFRVTSTLINNSVPLFSNVMKFVITPYAIPPKVPPPSSGELYLVGSATPGGWNNPVPTPSQKFNKTSPTTFDITISISGANSYLFLPVNGSWDHKYGGLGSNNANNPNGDDFKPEGGDLLAPTVSGNYKIEVDFQKGKFKLTKL